VLPAFGVLLPGFACAVLALGLNEGAYMAEIMRSGHSCGGSGQRLAARALGLEEWRVMRWVRAPAGVAHHHPADRQPVHRLIKLSALVSVIGGRSCCWWRSDRLRQFSLHRNTDAAGIYYLALTTVFMAIQSVIERSFRRRPGARRAMSDLATTQLIR